MARKSRKNLQQPEQAATSVLLPELEEAKIPAAIYGRLSVEDDEKEESMETQIALVQDYINRSRELSYVDTYFDNGFTGTNFKRPAFTRLMNDVRQKKIKCIVVKDLSRFGRNYLEAGYYIETVFPFLGIRLIAVTDNFDSTRKEDMESLALPIRNMVNAMYAKDISKKIWTSLQRKKEAGYAVGNDAPYGYIRNPMTKRNEIDPEAAFYVQLIFQWELMGVPIFEIARRMTLLQVPTPREWHRKMVEGKEVLTCKKWGVTTIRHILENQTYVGDTINNKSTQKLFAGQDRHCDLVSYAASFGSTRYEDLVETGIVQEIKTMLSKFAAISVRDENSAHIVKQLLGYDPEIHMDPVLMYDFAQEIAEYKTSEKDYIILYAYTGRLSREEECYIKKFANRHNKKIICIGHYSNIADKNIICNPLYVFSYFKNANYVITDTFHGTVFSIKMNTKFCTLVRDSNRNKLEALLNKLDKLDRKVEKLEDIERLYNTEVDFYKTNQIIEQERKKTTLYLKENI